MSSFSNSTHRLEGTGHETGGLIIKSKKKPEDKHTDTTFKKPSGSRLGLDLLARRKREQRQAEEETKNAFSEKKPRLYISALGKILEGDSDVRISFGRSDVNKDRHYRGTHVETPSHPGGVSDKALERFHTHVRKGGRSGDTGVYASTKTRNDRDRESNRERDNRRRRERDRYQRRDDRDRSERRRRGDEGRMSERSRGNDWERETPQYDVGTGDTPYSRMKGRTTPQTCKLYKRVITCVNSR